ncbi:MAG TPA: hypothetical protein VF713_11025, partial [Thermoanaerobaculia bacterium]
ITPASFSPSPSDSLTHSRSMSSTTGSESYLSNATRLRTIPEWSISVARSIDTKMRAMDRVSFEIHARQAS